MNAIAKPVFGGSEINQKTILSHPVGLFILFFTEMWERFSYYGMRAILVLFLISAVDDGGLGWSNSKALMLYAWYTGLVYLTPVLGGLAADKFIGLRRAVVLGAFIMTMGHLALAFETTFTFYLGLICLIIGNGFFKPNIASIVGQMYPKGSALKDAGYTIFYMGVNAGAFLGILICGWLGETKGWGYGFGCAGIFMALGLLQFFFGQKIFGRIGEPPNAVDVLVNDNDDILDAEMTKPAELEGNAEESSSFIPFKMDDLVLGGLSLLFLLGAIITMNVVALERPEMEYLFVLPFVLTAFLFVRGRILKFPKVEGHRLTVIGVLSFFIIFFWLAFEQAGGSMTIFSKNFTDRTLDTAAAANTFRVVNLIITLIPMVILTWVLVSLAARIFRKYPLTIVFTTISFTIIWGLVGLINYENFMEETPEVEASWFSILNALFIITFAPAFSALWVRLTNIQMNPSGPVKFALGLFLLGTGFAALVIGASSIPAGTEPGAIRVSMIWLILAYLFHTLGELCISPVGLSFVSKLSPTRLIGLMFGVFYLANFVANFTGGLIGSFMDRISETSSLSGFFMIFVVISFAAGFVLLLLNKPLKRMMHGIE